MKTYKSFISNAILTESSNIRIYHGDNYGTKKLDRKLMFHGGNNQVGIGIYFGTRETAEKYGKHIVSISINPKNFKDGHAPMGKIIKENKFVCLCRYLNKDDENFWMILTDYGIEVYDSSEAKQYHFQKLYQFMKDEEIRNVQIELAQYCADPMYLISNWNVCLSHIHGLYEKNTGFYSVIRDNYRVRQEKN